jgi:hypothetical protein
MADTQIARYRILGTTDECVECERCGRTELRSTVILDVLDAYGNVEDTTYFGSSCAARALGITARGASRKVLDSATAAHRKVIEAAKDARDRLAHYELPAEGVVTTGQIYTAARKFAYNHRNAVWAGTTTWDDWVEYVMDMISQHRKALVVAARLGV